MTGAELTAAREALGLTPTQLAALVGVYGYRTVHKWESGACAVPGPVAVILRAMLESRAVRRYFGVETAAESE